MITLKIPTIHCGSCANVIRQIIQQHQPDASVTVDVQKKTATINTLAKQLPPALLPALKQAGYEAKVA